MNTHPIVLLDPIFKWMDWLIAELELQLYIASVFLAPLVIAWILAEGFWRRQSIRIQRPPHLICNVISS